MQNTHKNYDKDGIDLLEIFVILWKRKYFILSLTSFLLIITIIYSISLPNIYKSEALLDSYESNDMISGAIQNYSSLANLAGISLPSSGGSNKAEKAIKKIKSFSFFENNILPFIYLPDLMAFRSWDSSSNQVTYKKDLYDHSKKLWISKNSNSNESIPSAQDSFQVFKNHLNIVQDKQTGFVTISIKHQSPYIAKEWIELIVREINTFYRNKDKAEAERSVDYLSMQIVNTSYSEIKQVIATLLQQETQKLTLIEAKELYIFDYIDPPVAMELKEEPNRSLIVFIGFFIGIILGIVLILFRHYLKLRQT